MRLLQNDQKTHSRRILNTRHDLPCSSRGVTHIEELDPAQFLPLQLDAGPASDTMRA